jgi:osmotically-inducible protein OsmY
VPANQGNGHVIAIWLPFNLESTTMNTFKRISAFLAAIAMMFMLGCASTTKHEGTGEYVDDTVITSKVKAAILEEPGLKSAEIKVETFKGVVQLSGFVSSRTSSNKAVELARGVHGVKSVKDDMLVK